MDLAKCQLNTEIINSLMGALLSKTGFHEFLELMAKEFNAYASMLLEMDTNNSELLNVWHHGIPDEYLEWYVKTNQIDNDFVIIAGVEHKPESVLNLAKIPFDPNLKPKIIKNFKAQGVSDVALAAPLCTDKKIFLFILQRNEQQSDFLQLEIDALNKYLPFIKQALQVYIKLSSAKVLAGTFSQMIEAFPEATLIFDENQHLLFLNQRAKQLIGKHRQDIRLVDKYLELDNPNLRHEMRVNGLRAIHSGNVKQEIYNETLVVKTKSGERLLFTFQSIAADTLQGGGMLVRIYSEGDNSFPDANTICQYYGLTNPESQLCEALLKGWSITEIAEFQQKSEQTLRGYLKDVYKKTGINKQGMLISEMLSSLMH
ncbi:helix-turn-helix transcriptional regulator [Paraferrimonas sp. SM1919]|uniref:helix-turn-helix transcriptional regulator n=1 Tax=Paraferrimonas sp. SM1919 TaxID=2662263 RepID=UPI0013D3CBA4|nr:helix-turn-helix transcriptional regulator [Paraferrimonas sp. SM1919]